ncbi:hypothetical protein [Streptomyces sp. NPDC057460]|uniref:hypothetical protein n=1 Tax=Streptomyces sp. NPDC057460 TaxID=3346141 RepID=UPI00369726CF
MTGRAGAHGGMDLTCARNNLALRKVRIDKIMARHPGRSRDHPSLPWLVTEDA